MNDSELQQILRNMEAADRPQPLPDPATIWWRAELRRRLAEEARVVYPIRLVERVACAACLLAVVVLAAVR